MLLIHHEFVNFKNSQLGTDRFYNSVKTVVIDYWDVKDKPNVDQDIDLVKEYFKNLDSVNLRNLKYLSIKEIVQMCIDNKQDKIF